jgi:hypothetical protein
MNSPTAGEIIIWIVGAALVALLLGPLVGCTFQRVEGECTVSHTTVCKPDGSRTVITVPPIAPP